jgi:hypothetical protein
MKGLEPSTFCMANARKRSRPFALVRRNRLFAGVPGAAPNGSEHERTVSVAIVAIARLVTMSPRTLPRLLGVLG